MTSGSDLDTDLPAIPAPTPTCDACPHPLEDHDPIGLRFCSITSTRGMSRGCACATT